MKKRSIRDMKVDLAAIESTNRSAQEKIRRLQVIVRTVIDDLEQSAFSEGVSRMTKLGLLQMSGKLAESDNVFNLLLKDMAYILNTSIDGA